MGWITFASPPLVERHLIVNCVLVFLTLAVVALRIWSRFLSGAKLWWDDYLILFAVPQGIGMLVIQGIWSTMGEGYPSAETMSNLTTFLKMLIAYELIYTTTITTVKLSVLFFYLRVFVNKGLRLGVKLAMGLVLIWTLGNLLQVFLICTPFAATYDPSVHGHCGNQVASYIAIGAFNVATDILVLALPIPTVWSLHMSVTAKLGLTGVFLIGLLVSIVAIVRIQVLATVLQIPELTSTMMWPTFWSAFEVNLAILCVSMPMLGTLWARCTRRRGASKLEGPSSDGVSGSYEARSSSKSTSKVRNQQRRDLGDTEIGLETIYASNREIHYESAVAAAGKTSAGHEGRSDGSQATLIPDRGSLRQDPSAIKVYTKWTITHDQARAV
ncbi:hypothetical protein B0H66DRAFT_384076 [Apodospora peruviana]|uniref:Rhodopsin domain-containing protein n=1 Tax=Apodospora peruviana TaxID=516989 RepID=A0AAE0HU96_9PEZI|nr:hypothetical protein B0H66DRAFT_384076 [Apodospora peruviana]